MNNFLNCSSSSDDDWTVVPESSSPTKRSATPFEVIDQSLAGRSHDSSIDADKIILSLHEENRELTEAWHRLKIENEWMAREIKGARFLVSKMLETLRLEHDKQEFEVVKNSNVREDMLCFQDLTRVLLHAVEGGLVKKVERTTPKNKTKTEHGEGHWHMDNTKLPSRDSKKPLISYQLEIEKYLSDNAKVSAPRSCLPRIEELFEIRKEVTPWKNGRTVMGYDTKLRNAVTPGVLHHVHGVSRKKRWGLNRGAPRQAFTARRHC